MPEDPSSRSRTIPRRPKARRALRAKLEPLEERICLSTSSEGIESLGLAPGGLQRGAALGTRNAAPMTVPKDGQSTTIPAVSYAVADVRVVEDQGWVEVTV